MNSVDTYLKETFEEEYFEAILKLNVIETVDKEHIYYSDYWNVLVLCTSDRLPSHYDLTYIGEV